MGFWNGLANVSSAIGSFFNPIGQAVEDFKNGDIGHGFGDLFVPAYASVRSVKAVNDPSSKSYVGTDEEFRNQSVGGFLGQDTVGDVIDNIMKPVVTVGGSAVVSSIVKKKLGSSDDVKLGESPSSDSVVETVLSESSETVASEVAASAVEKRFNPFPWLALIGVFVLFI